MPTKKYYYSKKCIVISEQGLCTNPTVKIIKFLADKYPKLKIFIEKEGLGYRADASSILNIMMLSAECGASLVIGTYDKEGVKAVDSLCKFIGEDLIYIYPKSYRE